MKIINVQTNREIIFDNKVYILNQVDLGNVSATHTAYKGINQIGEYVTNSTLESRTGAITGYIMADNKAQMDIRKRELYRLLNPLDKFVLIIDGKKLECIAQSTVKFAVKRYENSDTLAKFIINFECPNPCFIPVSPARVNIAQWVGSFHFPLAISQQIIMGYKTPSTIINVKNNGDIKTGIILEFTARGMVENPSILDVNSREFIKVNKIMMAGEVVRVNTNYGEKAVTSTSNNETLNIMGNLDLDSTFIQLAVGDNVLRYDADNNIENLEVDIYFSPKYLGV